MRGGTASDRSEQPPNRNKQIRNTGAVRNGNEGAITFRSSPGNAVNLEPHLLPRLTFEIVASPAYRPDMKHHGQPGRGGPQKPEGPHTPLQHGTLYAHLRAPASDFHRPAAPPKDLPGALEAPMAARLRGKRRAARSSVLHARGRRGTLPWHRPGRACRTKTPVALSSRAHSDNATVHISVTRRHCRVVPGSTRSCTRGAPGAHKGNTQGAAGSRPGRARVEPHRLNFRRKRSS